MRINNKIFKIISQLSLCLVASIGISISSNADDNSYSTYNYLDYSAGKYYILPDGSPVSDQRTSGALNPNLFTVVREYPVDGSLYFQSESEVDGCNLEESFRKHIYPQHGVNVRRYLNALSTTDCNSLSSSGERNLCLDFRNNLSCQSAMPIALLAMPITNNESYLTYKKDMLSFNCKEARDTLLANNFVPRESTEWKKIKSDLIDKQRKAFVKNLKKNPPVQEIRQQTLMKNPNATERDIKFAIQDYIYEQGQNFTADVSDDVVQQVAQMRYAPHGVAANLDTFSIENNRSCAQMSRRYNAKMYGEVTNIPPHLLILFNDYINPANQCLCK